MAAPNDTLHLGKDLLVTPFFSADEWDTVDLTRQPRGVVYLDEPVDLAAAAGVENLQQALILRLLTPLGSLRDLGHAGYGSRLHELIGEENVEPVRLRARAYVIQTLAQEGRVEETLSLEIAPPTSDTRDRLLIQIRVKARGADETISLGLEVGL